MNTNYAKSVFSLLFPLFLYVGQVKAENVVKEIPVRSFNEIELRGVGNIFLTQGDKESVRIETDTRLLSTVEIENEDNKLTIYSKIQFQRDSSYKMNIYITVRNLNVARFNGVGNIHVTNELNTGRLKFFATSTGKIDLNLVCKFLDVDFAGVGNCMLKGRATEMTLKDSGIGNIHAYDFKTEYNHRLFRSG